MNHCICLQSIHALKLGYCKTVHISGFCSVLSSHKSIYVTVVQTKSIHDTANMCRMTVSKWQRCSVCNIRPGSSLEGSDCCLLRSNSTLLDRTAWQSTEGRLLLSPFHLPVLRPVSDLVTPLCHHPPSGLSDSTNVSEELGTSIFGGVHDKTVIFTVITVRTWNPTRIYLSISFLFSFNLIFVAENFLKK